MLPLRALCDKVRELALAAPDFIYRKTDACEHGQCMYSRTTPGGENYEATGSGCIIGEAILALIPDATFYPQEGNHPAIVATFCGFESLGSTEQDRHSLEGKWLRYVQERQDLGHSWGAAVKWGDNIRPLPPLN